MVRLVAWCYASYVIRAVSAALHTLNWVGPTLLQGPKLQSRCLVFFVGLAAPYKALTSPN